jgi:valyl-tRNA synthetase
MTDPTPTPEAAALPPRYAPQAVEDRWYRAWEESGAFRPEVRPGGRPYVIMIPPPNVTGALHMGHALNNTLQDVLTRFERMRGRAALWLPGTDHAGIATQNVVEKQLAKEGTNRDALGREAFVARAWQWKEQYGGTIISQLRKLGCSCDWSRQRFTMDEAFSKAVTHTFVEWHEKGLIYQGERLINWCPRCLTALSDEEAESKPEKGSFFHLRYPIEGRDGEWVIVATTRPETMMGDTAVAVHPDDPRYRSLIGKRVVLPLANRTIPILADPHADPAVGSGAVKITPAHDFNDFEVGNRQGLPRIVALDPRGKMTAAAGAFAGLDRFEARKRIVAALTEQGLIDRVEEKEIALPRCYRCDTIVEPYLSKQWFVKMRPLLEPAATAVKEGRVRFVPERYARTYFDWVEQYRDWCISRQLWWGHRIPVYTSSTGRVVCAEEPPRAEDGETWTQDPDVLDTWFSSQLWPFATLGWPEKTADLARDYPTDVLVTAREIIYFWVARMVMCGIDFMGREPFHTVYITGTVLDAIGRRMSKSLGNGIDPVEMIGKYGADAVRWSMVTLATEGQDTKLAESRFEGGRNFVNKLWNASRFVLMSLEDFRAGPPASASPPEDRWIRSRANRLVREVTGHLEALRFDDVTRALHEFTWSVFCDWYLELTKSRLQDRSPEGAGSRRAAQTVLIETLECVLRLLHPVAPFVTEEIRSHLMRHLPGRTGMLIVESWPAFDAGLDDPAAEREIETLIAIVRTARAVRDDLRMPRATALSMVVRTTDAATAAVVTGVRDRAMALGQLSALEAGVLAPKPRGAVTRLVGGLEIFVPVAGLIDLDQERAKLGAEVEKTRAFAAGKRAKLLNTDFVTRAKPEIVEKERAGLADLEEKIRRLEANLADLT